MNLPAKFIQRLRDQKYIDATSLQDAFLGKSPASIRINDVKWQRKPAGSEQVPWCRNGFYLGERPSYTLDPLYHAGCYYPQEASGMFIEHIFRSLFGKGEKLKILDLCGAPGGKSTHLSSLALPDGYIVANEVIRSRAKILAENIAKWGNSNTIVTQNDPSAFRNLEGFFDLMLIDAPCSGEGMFRDPVAVREWSEENALLCSERQKRILMDAWPSLKEGGVLIYSTCTFNPAENEHNIKWITEKQEAESVRINISAYTNVTEIEHKGVYGYGFYPGRVKGEGLFAAVLKKRGKTTKKLIYSNIKSDICLSKSEYISINRLININNGNIIKTGNGIFKIPCELSDYNFLVRFLRIVSPGTKIFTVKGNDYLPSHELALSSQMGKSSYPVCELDYENAIAYLQRGNLNINERFEGWFVASWLGASMGFAKNIGHRINNYWPVEWRIRMQGSTTGGNPVRWV
ncbi:MAG: rRNA methyltransferase [Bacteroidales bacterium]|nr:rRNA methyltransferase [Bacteroidales bacterium]